MQINSKKIYIENNKITGIVCEDLYYLNKLNEKLYLGNEDIDYCLKNKSKNIELISIKDVYNDIEQSLEEFIISDVVKHKYDIEDLDNIIKMLGINKSNLSRNMSTLSISEKILALFAKILLHNPDIILVDNILSKLDSKLRDKIIKILIKLKNFNGKTIIISSTNVDIIYEYIDDIIIINNNECFGCFEKYTAYNKIDKDILEKPLVVDIAQKVYKSSGIKLGNNDSINELIKAIYREVR